MYISSVRLPKIYGVMTNEVQKVKHIKIDTVEKICIRKRKKKNRNSHLIFHLNSIIFEKKLPFL